MRAFGVYFWPVLATSGDSPHEYNTITIATNRHQLSSNVNGLLYRSSWQGTHRFARRPHVSVTAKPLVAGGVASAECGIERIAGPEPQRSGDTHNVTMASQRCCRYVRVHHLAEMRLTSTNIHFYDSSRSTSDRAARSRGRALGSRKIMVIGKEEMCGTAR